MKRNDSQFSQYPTPSRDSPPRSRQRLSAGSKFHEIFNQICALEKHLFKVNQEESHGNEPENQASETASENSEYEYAINYEYLAKHGMPLDDSLLTPDSMLTGEEDMEEYEEEFEEGEEGGEGGEELEEGEEGEELDEGLYDDETINEESVYRSLPQGLLSEYELAALEYCPINGEQRNGYPNYCGIPSNFTNDQNRNTNAEIQNLSVADNGPTTSRRACETLASLQETPWMYQPNFQPSVANGTVPVNNTNLFQDPALRQAYQKLLRQTYYLTKRAK